MTTPSQKVTSMREITKLRLIKWTGLALILYADWRIFLGYLLIKTVDNFYLTWKREDL